MTVPVLLTIHTDGASRGNPGPAAFAYIIARNGEEPIEEAGKIGRMTNNQAEYTALVRALEHALELGEQHRVLIHSDSELLVKQMSGQYRVKNEDLRDLYEEARDLCARFRGGVRFQHVRREQNVRADALGNEALDGLREPTPRASTVHPAARPVPKPAAPKPAAPSLRSEAVTCLRQAAAAWASGQGGPAAEEIWDRLLDVLRRHNVPSPPGAR